MSKKYRELVLFGISGVLAYVIDASVTTATSQILNVYIARIPAFLAAATFTWIFNRNITFDRNSSRHTSLLKEYTHYISLMIAGLLVNYIVYVVAVTFMHHLPFGILISIGIGSLAGMTVNFVNSKKHIFSGSPKKEELSAQD